jgi:DNA invertase Pin-like site-specific DNA recombinase
LTVRAALYIRLSVEDKHTRTISIETQMLILERFLEKHPAIVVYDKYIDNGATGTNFHRPAFQQMLSDIEAGYINCVIVKDLSRLGRNTIDTGYYIEQYFPVRKVRFIAVTDQYDSADPSDIHAGIILPLKNMINEAYALDIGRKIRAQQRQAMKDGEYVGGRTPYGYIKAKDNCHQLIVDPGAASVVKQMFEWASEGDGINTIVRKLNESGVISPSHYKKEIGQITHKNLIGSGKWQTWTVAKSCAVKHIPGTWYKGTPKPLTTSR